MRQTVPDLPWSTPAPITLSAMRCTYDAYHPPSGRISQSLQGSAAEKKRLSPPEPAPLPLPAPGLGAALPIGLPGLGRGASMLPRAPATAASSSAFKGRGVAKEPRFGAGQGAVHAAKGACDCRVLVCIQREG